MPRRKKQTDHLPAIMPSPAYEEPVRVDAILGADLHLRDDCPSCRTDGLAGYLAEQEAAVKYINQLCYKYECPFLVAGDIFDHWKPSPALLAWALRELPPMIFVPGQHDLPQHSMELYKKSGCAVLSAPATTLDDRNCFTFDPHVGKYSFVDGFLPLETELHGFPWDVPLAPVDKGEKSTVAIAHRMTWKSTLPFPGAEAAGEAFKTLKAFPCYDLILTGDNHQPFEAVSKQGDRRLVNPGSMMRMTAAQAKHRPRVYLWTAETNTTTPVYLPIAAGVVSREHIDVMNERDEKIDAFIVKLADGSVDDTDLDFIENVRRALRSDKIGKKTKAFIWKALEQ